MATAQPKSGVTEYTITAGTGALTLTGPAPGFRGFVSADDGLIYHYAIFQDQTLFETGVGTYTHSTRQLSRTNIKGNINGTTTPLNLGGGTKEVSIVIPGELVAMHDVNNQFTVDQFFNGAAVNLDVDRDTWIAASTDDVVQIFQNSIETVRIDGGLGQMVITGTDPSATEGPNLLLRRASTSPAANDPLGSLYMQGSISGTTQNAAKIRATWTSVGAGTFSSVLEFSVAGSGALQTILRLYPNIVSVPAGIALFTAGKTAGGATVVGAEMNADGSIAGITNGTTPLYISRNGAGTELISLSTGNTQVSSVTVSGGVVTWQTFTGSHWSEWAVGAESDEQFGTIVATTAGLLEGPAEHLPLVRLAEAGDPAVYGIIQTRMVTGYGLAKGEERALLQINGLGTSQIRCLGEIARGDLLRVSTTPGVAEAQPDDIVRSTTVAKATQDSADDGGERLVPCVLMAG